jgi:hypothetical protein
MRFGEIRSVEGTPEDVITIKRTWEGVEVVFGGDYVVTMGKAEWKTVRERIDSYFDAGLL